MEAIRLRILRAYKLIIKRVKAKLKILVEKDISEDSIAGQVV